MTSRSADRVHDFGGLTIQYDERVLAPRDWTTAQSYWAAELIAASPPGQVLELCSGAGHIGLLAVQEAPRPLVCVDANPAACDLVRENARANGLRVDVREGPMDVVLHPAEQFPIIIADPPWVERALVGSYPEDPASAIDGGPDGLDLVRLCLTVIADHLMPTGSSVLQVGPTQVGEVTGLVARQDALRVVEVREFEEGALVRLDRRI
uniref:class I SAM-dependent methyltransferase n=1 Tax=Nocardioides sp. TaxID=35761 RepID=UPI002E36C397|nr:class I SAM-dependent methyltransferase [Nocardioides sp.]HEX5087803.1 class I SAM-dependent methyltransferase [Nocardioides sp.]